MKQIVTYNGYSFPYTTMNVSAAVMYDEAHAVVGTLYTFRITGTLIAPTGKATLDSEIYNMRNAIMTPRKEFKIDWQDDSGTSQYVPYNFDADDDVDFGPRTQDLQLFKFTGGRAALYDWTIVVFAKECWASSCSLGTGGSPDASCQNTRGTEILSITQQYSHRIDVNGMTTRTISGKIVVTAKFIRSGQSVDSLRMAVTPPLPFNYRRTGYDFSQSADGRELTYSVTDEEQVFTLPQPVTDGNATWTVRIQNGSLIQYELNGFFAAPATVPKATLIQLIGQLVERKFPLGRQDLIFESRSLSEAVYGNRIDFSITATSGAGKPADKLPDFNVGMITFITSPPNDGNQAYQIYPYGGDQNQTSGTIAPAVTKTIWDACISLPYSLSWNQNYNPGGSVGYDVGNPRPDEGDNPYDGGGVSQSHVENPFVAYNEVFSYEIASGIVVFAPKSADKGPITQQTHAPRVTLVRAGYAVRYATTAAEANQNGDFPPPPTTGFTWANPNETTAGYICTHASVSPEAPEPVGDSGWNKYTVRWRYVLERISRADTAETLSIKYPHDPRRPDTSPEYVLGESPVSEYDTLIIPAGHALP